MIRGKVAAYKAYIERVLRPEPERAEVLFACDGEREKRAAVESGDELGVVVVASSVRGVASYLEACALER